MAKSAKKIAWDWCSRYCRLRDALAYCRKNGIDLRQFARIEDIVGACCTCGKVLSWVYMDAGHFIGRGLGGRSGVYFDERNINLQCKPCNGFKQGSPLEYRDFMLKRYGQQVIDNLRILDKTQSYKYKIEGIGIMYKEMYKKLKGDAK